jgi:crotonobetainyl-CoA:carnitine CoA-transferase CaiB-like acyl-CoA transferase
MNEQTKNENGGLFSGIKVVDLTQALSGPTCTVFLADMGAEVIKVQAPGAFNPRDLSYYNRNKKSITLNLKTDKGKEIMRRLVLWGDVLVENYRPGVMKRLGFDYPDIKKINPRMIMTSISGYGQTGPYAGRGGIDTVGQAMGGLMSLIGPADGPPMDAGMAIADISSGVFAALGTVMALYRQRTTGLGQHVEVSLVDSIVYFLTGPLIDCFRGNPPQKGNAWFWKRLPGGGWFQAKDGPWVVIMAEGEESWPRMAALMGRPELATSPGYTNRKERGEHAIEIHDVMAEWAIARTADEIEAEIAKEGIPFGRVQTLPEVLNDPGLRARGMFKDVNFDGLVVPLFGPYPQLSETPGSFRTPAPRLGDHNEEIYCELMGFSKEDLNVLKQNGVI